ncbi:MAG: MCE family protein [Candidatus Latescibacteria bacterium]|nr:MCE family protein [Candidatus Latescibacterota bacterium]
MEAKKTVTWKDLKVGLLAASSLVIVTITILLMGGGKIELFKDKIPYRTFFPDANGLKAGSEVWLAGVEIGQVKFVRFSDTRGRNAIEVVLEVDVTARNRIRTDSVASLRTIGLLGDKYVELTPGTLDVPTIPPGGIIKGLSLSPFDELIGVGKNTAQGFNDLMVQLQQLATNATQGEGSIGKLIQDPELYRNLNTSAQQTSKLIETAQSGPGTMGQLMSNPALYDNLMTSSSTLRETVTAGRRTVASTDSLIRELRRAEGTIGKLATDPALYNQMETTLLRLDGLLRKMERGEGTVGRLTQKDAIAQEAEGLLIDLRSLVNDIKQNPKRYIKVSVF